MSINWDIVQYHAKKKAKEFADKSSLGRSEREIAMIENAYFQGYMENAAERESLRVINDKLQKQIENLTSDKNKTNTETFDDLDGLI